MESIQTQLLRTSAEETIVIYTKLCLRDSPFLSHRQHRGQHNSVMVFHAAHKIVIDKNSLILGETVPTGLSWPLWWLSKDGHTHLPWVLAFIVSGMAQNSEMGIQLLHKDIETHCAQALPKAGRTNPTYSKSTTLYHWKISPSILYNVGGPHCTKLWGAGMFEWVCVTFVSVTFT